MTTIDLQTVAECAALAPSVHNSQPWQFVAHPDALEVRADRSRRLGYLDPDGRLMHISCGAAIEFARLAVRAAAFACTVELLPDPSDSDLLARVVVGAGLEASALEQVLVEAIPRRYTDRGDYDARLVPRTLVAEAQTALASYGVWVKAVDKDADRTGLALALAAAEAAETSSPDYAAELARWVHPGNDGVPLPAVTPPVSGVVTDMPRRAFVEDGRRLRLASGPPPLVMRNSVLILGTDSDTPRDWLTVGAGLAWLQLRAAVDNIATQPLGPATDFPAARARLRRELGLLGHPQFVLRMGYGTGRPWAGRRSPETMFAASR
jgi:nitroreductase